MTEKKFGQPISMRLLIARTLFGVEAAIMMLAGVFDIIIGLSPNITSNFLFFHLSGSGSVAFGTIVGVIGLGGLILSFTVRKPSQSKVNAVYGIMAAFLILMLLEGSIGYLLAFLLISGLTAYLLWQEVNSKDLRPEESQSQAPVAPQSEQKVETPSAVPDASNEDTGSQGTPPAQSE